MNGHATGTFDITNWTELATEEKEGATFGRNAIAKTFHGDLTGTSTTEILTVVTPEGPAAYVGVEHFDGTLHGRKGTFALQHSAGSHNGEQWLKWQVVPTSGTGELAGLTGEGTIRVDGDGHHYLLDYTLPED
ncbi:DUF3224 domain-containing protein [Microbispora hainanensis]|jgi:hypothetical protein|uniref:DUF3224 domain-containing protein n=1 Tax=Microbispora hainanensis TaxID=568844 RepID=A0ABZ1SX11_9ACTN|nr:MULTISPECIES: DUF3224 domain-containing protein [Microbispora]NJP28606.1 DUF3224 domain-containing protein [Microbispora sp. CL1-1]TQS07588.1 DUF3224 domain-containing protein [Microbispora sp. SCL1-1]